MNQIAGDVPTIARVFRERFPTVDSLYLRFGTCVLEVAVNDSRVARALLDYFGDFAVGRATPEITITVHEALPPNPKLPLKIKEPDPGKSKIKEEYADLPGGRVVRKRLTGMLFVLGEKEQLAVGPCLDNINQVVNFINNRYIEWLLCKGGLLGHASGVILENKGLAIAGFSGAGKSTLAMHLMGKDAIFVSNDRLVIRLEDDRPVMHGVVKFPRINPGTAMNNPKLRSVMPSEDWERFSKLPSEELWDVEHKYDVPIDRCFGPGRFVLDAPMDCLIILSWKRDRTPLAVERMNPADRPDLMQALMKSTGLFFQPSPACPVAEPILKDYVELLSRCSVWEFSGGIHFEQAAATCISIAKSEFV